MKQVSNSYKALPIVSTNRHRINLKAFISLTPTKWLLRPKAQTGNVRLTNQCVLRTRSNSNQKTHSLQIHTIFIIYLYVCLYIDCAKYQDWRRWGRNIWHPRNRYETLLLWAGKDQNNSAQVGRLDPRKVDRVKFGWGVGLMGWSKVVEW